MSLKNKTVIIIGLWALALFFLSVFTALFQSITAILLTLCLCGGILYLLIRQFVIQPIELLNQHLIRRIKGSTLTEPLQLTGKDEVSNVIKNTMLLLECAQKTQTSLESTLHQSTLEIEKLHFYLQQEKSERFLASKPAVPVSNYLTDFAHFDATTSLPNRIVFNEILNKSISHAKRRGKVFAILLLEINILHLTEAELHKLNLESLFVIISKLLKDTLRSEDILAKLEGGEFIILLNDIVKPKFAGTVAEKLLAACAKPLKIDGKDIFLTANIGISIYPTDGDSLEVLIKNVDTALYRAKQMENNAYHFHSLEIEKEARKYTQLGSELRNALQKNELILYFQPKLHIKKGLITGVEALLRWQHPKLGIILPGEFMPIAEEIGLSLELAHWALMEACETNKRWQAEGYEHLNVAINISAKQFYHPDMGKVLSQVLTATQLNPTYLELEITEQLVMEDMGKASAKLKQLKSTGVIISLDHFGTGYTSISHLKQFPISIIKIDASFIKGLPNNPDDLAITQALIGLGHHLGLETIAEGVETAEQVQCLAELACDMVQGYFLSHPLPAEKIALQFKKLGERVLMG